MDTVTGSQPGGARLAGAVPAALVGVPLSGPTYEITAPATGERLAVLPTSTADDVAEAHARARAAAVDWAATAPEERAALFLALYDRLMAERDDILDVIQLETGKAREHAFEEFLDATSSTLYYARQAPRLLRPRRRAGALPVLTRPVEWHHPLGVVAMITPWNYPFALAADVVPALLAGNAVVHKPDSTTVLASLAARARLVEAGLPAGLWQVAIGDPAALGGPLLDEADYVGFTGSTKAGLGIAKRAAERLIGCSLELGGKNQMLVLADADLGDVGPIARACFASAGQLCVSIERILVHRSRYDDFVARFVQHTRDLCLGFALDYHHDIGSLTSATQLARVSAAVDQARADGATVAVGGRARPDLGPYFYEPTVLLDVPACSAVLRTETFGPVVTIVPFDDEDEAVRRANDTPYGLNAAIWSRDVAHARRLAGRLQAGTVNINEGYAAAYGSPDAPMGGVKASGLGRRHGAGGLLKYTWQQTVAAQHLVGIDPPFGMSRETFVEAFSEASKLLRRLRIR